MTETDRPTSRAANLLSLGSQDSRLEVRRHYSQRVTEDWNNKIPQLKRNSFTLQISRPAAGAKWRLALAPADTGRPPQGQQWVLVEAGAGTSDGEEEGGASADADGPCGASECWRRACCTPRTLSALHGALASHA